MINLNLLPPEEKEALVFEKLRRQILFLGRAVFFLLLIFIVLAFSLYFHLAIILGAQTELIKATKSSQEIQRLEKNEEDVRVINSGISKIYDIQNKFVLWSEVLTDLMNSIPQGVYFQSFSGQGSQITISGFAPTREGFLNFEESLKKNKRFYDVYSPVSNLIKKTDIDFSISFKFNPSPSDN